MSKGKSNIKILYIYPGKKSSFVAKDIRLLSSEFEVDEYYFNSLSKKKLPAELLKQKLFLLRTLFRYKVYIIKFGGYWSLIPVIIARIFGKRSIIITGGTDCVAFPELGYGYFQMKPLNVFTKLSFKFAHHIVALHSAMIDYNYTYFDAVIKHQGIKAHVKNLKTPFSIVYNGYDKKQWQKTGDKNAGGFITVAGGIADDRGIVLKGVDMILETARLFPGESFTIVGRSPSELNDCPPNVKPIEKATQKELAEMFSSAEFYLQLSVSEGFPNSLCEAMLCECVPVVSNVNSMPFIVGDTGFVLERKDINLLKELLEKALKADTETLGKKARQRIAENFTEEKRKEGLIMAVRKGLEG
jgi:glycosyltransferase involved in cell wall biosynthesis